MTEKPKETPKEELECPKKYVYDTGIIFECKDNSKVEIIGEDVVDLLNELTEEKDYWKKQALLLEKKYNEIDGIEWLRNNTVWEQMPTNTRTYTITSNGGKND